VISDTTGNQQLLKDINRMALVRRLFVEPGMSRADLASTVGLTKSTVSLLVRELIEEGWMVEREIVATGDLGRRPTPLFIDPGRLLLVGADVGVESARVVATSLTGHVLASSVVNYGASKTAKACITSLANAMLKVRAQLEGRQHRIIGMGVGLPGGVDEVSGFLHFAPNLGWRDVPFASMLRQRLEGTKLDGLPLFLLNEADVAVLGETEFNPSADSDPLLYLSMNEGVGAGVIFNDRLLTGNRGFAGEVGHVVLQINGPTCSCGRRGCAEALIGPRAILGTADGHAHALAEIGRRVEQQDPELLRNLKKAGGYLGVLLQNLTSAYDPGTIVIGGRMAGLGDVFLQPALRTLGEYLAAANLPSPKVRISRFGEEAVAVGAAALARYRLTRPLLGALAGSGSPRPGD
jgi:predicted NBD/HSP70 family sugar kinase/DNA-binding XRE family transcriptional regulator